MLRLIVIVSLKAGMPPLVPCSLRRCETRWSPQVGQLLPMECSSIIAIFSGAQMLCVGIIGSYLGRAHFRLLDRPTYVVRDDSGAAPTIAAPPG